MRCVNCKTTFEPTQFRQKHCKESDECQKAYNDYVLEERQKKYEKNKTKQKIQIKRTPIKRSKIPIKKMSEKRKLEYKIYTPLKKEYMLLHPKCERCITKKSKDLHHKNGREGERLYDVRFFMAACRDCHDWIHLNPEQAREDGYLI